LYTSENRLEINEKVLNVVLEKDGEDQLNRSCKERGSITQSQGESENSASNTKKVNVFDWLHLA
jgi:hypothetical protein